MSRSNGYVIGHAKPPEKYKFRRGQSGNPSGKRRKPSAPDLGAQLQSALSNTVTVDSGKKSKVITKGAAGIEQLVDQFARGDRNARRDLLLLAEKLGVNLTDREALEGALEDVMSAQDEAILADFVERHGGKYAVSTKMMPTSSPVADAKLLTSPTQKSLPLASRGLTESQLLKQKSRRE
jgi:hypothetical protein